MFVNLHVVLILMGVVAPVVAVGFSPGWRPRPLKRVFVAASPIVIVGILCLLLLMAGIPVAEWLFPLVGLVIAGLFVKSERAFQMLRWSLAGLATVLSINGLELRGNGYTSDVALSRRYEGKERAHLVALQDELKKLPADKVFPEGPVAQVLDHPAKWDRRALRPAWHTFFTGLYQVTTTPGDFWYPGGAVAVAQLRWQPRDQ